MSSTTTRSGPPQCPAFVAQHTTTIMFNLSIKRNQLIQNYLGAHHIQPAKAIETAPQQPGSETTWPAETVASAHWKFPACSTPVCRLHSSPHGDTREKRAMRDALFEHQLYCGATIPSRKFAQSFRIDGAVGHAKCIFCECVFAFACFPCIRVETCVLIII